ncbi:hypothetical protein EV426DRAFT_683429 [Tirmania nivea]|nr:hypothetical protein EV426DRAFT_683429 [Tirmania nivea]
MLLYIHYIILQHFRFLPVFASVPLHTIPSRCHSKSPIQLLLPTRINRGDIVHVRQGQKSGMAVILRPPEPLPSLLTLSSASLRYIGDFRCDGTGRALGRISTARAPTDKQTAPRDSPRRPRQEYPLHPRGTTIATPSSSFEAFELFFSPLSHKPTSIEHWSTTVARAPTPRATPDTASESSSTDKEDNSHTTTPPDATRHAAKTVRRNQSG